MQSVAIIASCIGAAIAYGILHDQVTARVCIEYFTVAHPRILITDSATTLAIFWGVVATWWVGLLLGVGLAVAARAGSYLPRAMASLVKPVCWLLLIMACLAGAAGVAGWFLGQAQIVNVAHLFRLPADRNAAFVAAAAAHQMSYAAGFVGGLIIMIRVWRSRRGETMDFRDASVP